eukprot:m.33534 g.33534  ORF g.33534 m.33534 type:complete len:122 (+) comp9869_c0_seq1:1203-1568(+)
MHMLYVHIQPYCTHSIHFIAYNQGAILSAVACVECFSTLFGPVVFNQVYPATVDTLDTSVFLVAAGITLLTTVGLIFVAPNSSLNTANDQYTVDNDGISDNAIEHCDENDALLGNKVLTIN